MKTQFEKEDVVEMPYGFRTKPNAGITQFLINKSDVLAVNKGMKERMIDFCSRHCISTNEGIEECIEIFDNAVKRIKLKGDEI